MYTPFFFFNDTATTEIYTLSLHDALPICSEICRPGEKGQAEYRRRQLSKWREHPQSFGSNDQRSEEHTSELQSRQYLVCRLLLEKKKTLNNVHTLSAAIVCAATPPWRRLS